MISTSVEQSKRLLALGLDKDTADMTWKNVGTDWLELCVYGADESEEDIPAWSLSALLEVMRKANAVTTLQVTSLSTFMRCKDLGFIWQNDLHINDPVSAAYEMVCYLLRNGHIKEGGAQ